MPKIDTARLETRVGSPNYPAPFRHVCDGRHKTALGNAVDLTQFGVNLTRLEPGAASALRHWHEKEDEFVWILDGELVLVEDDGETMLQPGDCAGFKAGVANGHHLVNRSKSDALYLEIGTRSKVERAHYPDDDLAVVRDENGAHVLHKSGAPY